MTDWNIKFSKCRFIPAEIWDTSVDEFKRRAFELSVAEGRLLVVMREGEYPLAAFERIVKDPDRYCREIQWDYVKETFMGRRISDDAYNYMRRRGDIYERDDE